MARQKLLPRRRSRDPSATERTTGIVILLLVVVIVALVMSGGAGDGPAGLPEPPPAAPTGLPLTSPAGWPRGQVERYDEGTVYERINGKADIYVEFGFAELACASYSDPAEPTRYVDVYIYDMGRPLNGFGIYRAQRSGAEESLDGADEACGSGASAFALRGRYYVEFIGSGDDAAAEVRALVGPVAASLEEPGDPVTVPDWFPVAGRKTVRYVLAGALGVGALEDVFIADYEDGTRAFVARYQDAATAEEAAGEAGTEFEFYGTASLLRIVGPSIVGVIDYPDQARADALADEIATKLGGKR